jgi:hypothetical protein
MAIIDDIRKFGNSERESYRLGQFNLAKGSDRRKAERLIVELVRHTEALTRKDIGDWRKAWQWAINVEDPNRSALYDIYRDVDVDLHLSGCVAQRKGFLLASSYKLTKPDGAEDEDALRLFDKDWFKQLLRHALDSVFWGHSLVELGNVVVGADGLPMYDEVRLIPRKHVVPEMGVVKRMVNESWRSGIPYRESPYFDWLVEIGQPDDLGLYLKAATSTIPKKHALAFWDSFAEIFGMPMRVARTQTRDPKEFRRLESLMRSAANKLSMVTDTSTEIQFVESGKSDAFNVYDRRVDRANSEISKLIVGQTMTIEDGSSLSQSQTHLKVFDNLVEADKDMIRDMVNDKLLPRMVEHGFPVKGLRFDWDYSVDYTPEQQIAYETMIADRYDVKPEYFSDKYGMPVGERREMSFGTPSTDNKPKEDEEPKDEEKDKRNNSAPFFD